MVRSIKNRNNLESKRKKRRFIGVTFRCCNIYTRIYLKEGKKTHIGWCPKCGAKLELLTSPTGSRSNFFITS